MTLQEILKSQGLSEEQIQKIVGEMKQNKIFTASEENLDIRYGKLKGDFDNLTKQHGESTALIEQMKKDNAGNEAMQGKITEYEGKIATLEKELQQTRVDSALKVALLEAKVLDVDYLTFKLKEKGEKMELDEQGNPKHEATYVVNSKNQLVDMVIDRECGIVEIPARIGAYGVETLSSTSFQNNCYLRKITIPATVKLIETNAFKGCHNLKDVIFHSLRMRNW